MSNEELGRQAAEQFREEFNLGALPIVSLVRLIERSLKVDVAFINVPEHGHGATMSYRDRHLIAVGCTQHPMRLRSTLAHELGHLRLGSVNRSLNHSAWDDRNPEEIQADSFARHLLIPLEAVKKQSEGVEASQALLSDLVQTYLASPQIVAIQMRQAGVIDQNTYSEWKHISTKTLAVRFGWTGEYQALVLQSTTPRAPQVLYTRALYAYQWGLISAAAIARMSGNTDVQAIEAQLANDGIISSATDIVAKERPPDSGVELTPEELKLLRGR